MQKTGVGMINPYDEVFVNVFFNLFKVVFESTLDNTLLFFDFNKNLKLEI